MLVGLGGAGKTRWILFVKISWYRLSNELVFFNLPIVLKSRYHLHHALLSSVLKTFKHFETDYNYLKKRMFISVENAKGSNFYNLQ